MKIRKQTFILIIIMLMTGSLNAFPLTYYNYFTMSESTRFGELIPFIDGDTLYGRVRSNDYIAITGSPQFHDQVYTSEEIILAEGADPFFEHEPLENVEVLLLPDNTNSIRRNAAPFVDTENGRYMITIELGDGIADISRYLMGGDPADREHVTSIGPLIYNAIFVDGDCEVYGELSGNLTIGSAGDMWLIDNIVYPNSDRLGIWCDDSDPGGMLGLVSERNIIIRDNWANGKGNMRGGSSIIINAAMAALGGSFTFQHQNDDWEMYQGPTPDERGYIRIKGSIAQRQKGYLHRDNHEGTGYHLSLNYDTRLSEESPPWFDDNYGRPIYGRQQNLRFEGGSFVLTNVIANRLIVMPGVEVILVGPNPLTVRGDIEINGTEENPVIFQNRGVNAYSTIRGDWGNSPKMNLNHVNFLAGISLDLNGDSINVANCSFAGEVILEGKISVDSSVFNGKVTLTSFDNIDVHRSVFTDGVTIDGNTTDGNFVNNTVVGAAHEGIKIRRFRSLRIVNNIIAFNRWGIVNRDRDNPVLRYNDVFENRHDDYYGCEAGEGSISVDPRFLNFNEGDYNLMWNSPCIDAGDPDSPLDADGSRADMGALAIDHELSVPDESILPSDFSVSAFPNPFNDVVKIKIMSPISGVANWKVVDINGREIATGNSNLTSDSNEIVLSIRDFRSAGLYFLNVSLNGKIVNLKLVYIN